jgi:DNA invertase Pin-like site-specific DNA recombinase
VKFPGPTRQTEKWRCARRESVRLRITDIDRRSAIVALMDGSLFLHQQGLDTTTSAGKAMIQMLGVFAEFERGTIRERVNAGLARARANGTKLGRRRVKPSVETRILELRDAGDGILKIGKKLGIGTSVVQRVFRETPWKRQSD